jgi:hypothetical protein
MYRSDLEPAHVLVDRPALHDLDALTAATI